MADYTLWFEPVQCDKVKWEIPVFGMDNKPYWAAQSGNTGTWSVRGDHQSVSRFILSDSDFRENFTLDIDACRDVAREARLFSANTLDLLHNQQMGAAEDVSKYMRNANATGHFSACCNSLADFFEKHSAWPTETLVGLQRPDEIFDEVDPYMLTPQDFMVNNGNAITADISDSKAVDIPEDYVIMAMLCLSHVDGQTNDTLIHRAVDAILQSGEFTDGKPVVNSLYQQRIRQIDSASVLASSEDVACVGLALEGAREMGFMDNQSMPVRQTNPSGSNVVQLGRSRTVRP